ncbi:forms a complex with the other RRN protein RRN6 and RRN11 [Colletotrichum graminicola M1.001]|uniref:Forms a complex with the other RRN protein RRN6 and RRN11 n=1 Tax=Colletotrichum graminicola (strain M1.001 / M2 / FGSC 10212) TaxID=645133 RepID=E3Q9Q1_COLGM|nr:forms a complex with the other RRN protein RRN6 and RRN11 [Colletotrichum graminicola M1.001]EFQ27589.1 forms a complex with the other RRN protein RRN6 and RRN11 [Colletotrichum graminicola M1.001]
MAPERELHKFPKGERCEFCGSRKWYLESGLRYCAKEGHQLQVCPTGYVEFDLGDEDFGQKGRVSRKQKQVKERVKRVLSGQQARDLYLECLQLILREQILWLVTKKGHAAELETVVRDLWDLRTCGAPTVVHDDSASEREPSLFSSQLDLMLDEPTHARTKRAQSWAPEDGSEWPAPRVMDTLGLCILGCVLLRIPTRIGDIARWARAGSIPYREAYWQLPQEMRDRLPPSYTTPLKAARLAAFDHGELHASVLNLALSYHLNYNMVFPPLNDVLMTLQYVRELGLPASGQDEVNFLVPRLDWEKWRTIMAPALSTGLVQMRVDHTDVTASQILSMGPAELDDYFAHLSLLTDAQGKHPQSIADPLSI